MFRKLNYPNLQEEAEAILIIFTLLLCSYSSMARHRDYIYDISDDNPDKFQNRLEEREIIKHLLNNKRPDSHAACQGNELSYNVNELKTCEIPSKCNISFTTNSSNDILRFNGFKNIIKLIKDTITYHTKKWANIITIILKFLPIIYFIILFIFTHHFDKKITENPRLLDGSSAMGQRSYVYDRPQFNLWDSTIQPTRLVGLIQRFIVWRDNVEGSKDHEIANKFKDSGFSPKIGTNFHVAANIPIPELDEDELTEAQALKRRIKKYGVMTLEQFRYTIEEIHARRLVLTAAKEYQRRVIERGDEPFFDAQTEATESMNYALNWSRQERLAIQTRIENERKERDKTVDGQWEKSNKTFRAHRQRMREHEEKTERVTNG